MKIAFILPSLANKGPIIMARDLISYLISGNEECEVFYFDDIREIKFPCRTQQLSFFNRIDFAQYQIIHSHLFRPDLYCAFHKNCIQKSSAKVLTTVHTAIFDDLAFTYGNFIPKLIIPMWVAAWRRLDRVVLLNKYAKSYYSGLRFKNVSVINNGRDIPLTELAISNDDIQVIEELKSKHILLGTVCSIDKRKGLEQIIGLLALQPQYAFLVVGDGAESSSLKALAIKHGVSSRFKILGFRPDGFRFLNHFDLFLLPSRSEGMPLALLEAMALRVPIVCAKIPAIASELTPEEVVFFELDNVKSLIDACNISLANRAEIADNAFKFYAQFYKISQMGFKYLELYRSLHHID